MRGSGFPRTLQGGASQGRMGVIGSSDGGGNGRVIRAVQFSQCEEISTVECRRSNFLVNFQLKFAQPAPRLRFRVEKMSCTYCGSRQHTIKNCPKTWAGGSNRQQLRCGYCGEAGHNSMACPHNASASRRRKLNDDFFLD